MAVSSELDNISSSRSQQITALLWLPENLNLSHWHFSNLVPFHLVCLVSKRHLFMSLFMPRNLSLFHNFTWKLRIFIIMFGSESMLICSLASRLIWRPSSNTCLPHLSPPSPQTELGQKLSLCSKLCFAIGGAPKEVAASATAFFLQIYLLDIAQVTCRMSNSLKKERICLSSEWFNFSLSLFPSHLSRSTLSRPPWCCLLVKPGVQWLTPLSDFSLQRADGPRLADSCPGETPVHSITGTTPWFFP